ncbi:MAG TPA: hypothetical protein EYP87_02710 [Flavobacteriaceae bacterium]|nr:hypothetical protein [Flavobacteriaceae bacterium]
MTCKIIIIDDTHPTLIKELEKNHITCKYQPNITRHELISIINNFSGIIVRSKTKIDRELIDAAQNLKIIGRYGSGMENIDVNYARNRGIVCMNAPEGNRNAVAEHTIGLLFALLNKICVANQQVKNGIWNRNYNWGQEIENKTIGIIGYGNTGSTFAKKLCGFSVNVLVYDKYKTGFSNQFIKEMPLEKLFETADVLSLHIPLNEETNNMVNAHFISQFKKPFFLLNTSRGQIINTVDLIAALKSGKIQGAALDVLEYEKANFESMFSENKTLRTLTKFENVILTPHIAGWSNESYEKLAKTLARKIIQYKNK